MNQKIKSIIKKTTGCLCAVATIITSVNLGSIPVQAADTENVTKVDVTKNDDLWKMEHNWTKINKTEKTLKSYTVTGDLKVKKNAGEGDYPQYAYFESTVGIFSSSGNTTSTITANHENIGEINGRKVNMKVTYTNFYGLKSVYGMVPGLYPTFVDEDNSGVLVNDKFWSGTVQTGIRMMHEKYEMTFADTGESISMKGAYTTANSLNKGEAIRYNTQGADTSTLNTFIRTDSNLSSLGFGYWRGDNNDFVDSPSDDSFTKNSVSFQLVTDSPGFYMISETGDYWHSFTVAPLGATLPDVINKVGVDSNGKEVEKFENVKIGESLQFKVSQQVGYIGITTSLKYKSFDLCDQLPAELSYKNAYIEKTSEDGTTSKVAESDYTVKESGGLVTASFTADYLENMDLEGETYSLVVNATVNEKAISNISFKNVGWSVVNDEESDKPDVPVTAITPELAIDKSVDKYEYKAGEYANYTVKVKQTVDGAVAKDVIIEDISLPKSMEIDKDSLEVTGTDISFNGEKVDNTPTVNVEGSTFSVKVPYIADNEVVVTFKALVHEDVSGMEIINTATATASNVDEPVEDNAKIWSNTPEISITKVADREDKTYNIGDIVTYTIEVTNTKPGTIARNVVISDVMPEDGVKLQKSTIVIMDSEGNVITPKKTNVKGNTFTVDTGLNLVNSENYIVHDGEEQVQEIQNPLEETLETKITIEYAMVITDINMAGQSVENIATADSDDTEPVEDTEIIKIPEEPEVNPYLEITKEADKEEYVIGDTATYTLNVKNIVEDSTAKQVVITDTPDTADTELQADTIKLMFNGKEIEITEDMLTVDGNKFTLATGLDLTAEDELTITYDVLFNKAVEGNAVRNVAVADSDNTDPTETEETVVLGEAILEIAKTSDKNEYAVGDTGKYEVTVTNKTPDTVASKVVIEDEMTISEAVVKHDTIKLYLNDEEVEITEGMLTISDDKNMFTLETGLDITSEDVIKVTYDVEFTAEISGDIVNIAKASSTNTGEVTTEHTVTMPKEVTNPNTPNDEDTGGSKKAGNVQTSDSLPWIALALIVLGAAVLGGVVIFRKKKNA